MGIISAPFGWLMYFIESFVHNYGLSLFLFVIVTRLILVPLSVKQKKSTAKTMAIQPKLKALEKKYGKNKEKYQQEMMKLYEDEGVSMTAGCFPSLIQMLLMFGIIDVIYNPLKHIIRIPADVIKEATKFLGTLSDTVYKAPQIEIIKLVQNGSTQFNEMFGAEAIDKIKNFDMMFMGINLGEFPTWGWNLLIIVPFLAFASAMLQTIVTMKINGKNGQEMQGSMKYMFYFMPFMSLFICFSMPVGMGLYWTLSSLLMVAQDLILNWIYPMEKLLAAPDKNAEKRRAKMKARREKMAELQEKIAEQNAANASEKTEDEAPAADEDSVNRRLAEARRRMAEKYGDDLKD